MKCQICGKDADYFYVFDSDGYKKKVAYCKKCLVKVLKDSLPLSKSGIRILAAHSSLVQESFITRKLYFEKGKDKVFVRMSPAVLRILFKRDSNSDERILKEMYKREMYFLQRRLERAIRREDYKSASKIRDMINRIKNLLERK